MARWGGEDRTRYAWASAGEPARTPARSTAAARPSQGPRPTRAITSAAPARSRGRHREQHGALRDVAVRRHHLPARLVLARLEGGQRVGKGVGRRVRLLVEQRDAALAGADELHRAEWLLQAAVEAQDEPLRRRPGAAVSRR